MIRNINEQYKLKGCIAYLQIFNKVQENNCFVPFVVG